MQCTIPAYGSSLRAALQRCDVDGDGSCSWSQVMSFFERAKQLLLDEQLMTSAGFEKMQLQRTEEKLAAELRLKEAITAVATTTSQLLKHIQSLLYNDCTS